MVAELIVRNVEEDLVRLLELRAAQHNRSAEAEHREILREALLPRGAARSFANFLLEMPDVGKDQDFERIRETVRPVDL